jgi:ribosomal protein S8
MTDLLSIACSRINVASLSRHPITYVPFSKLVSSFLAMLVKLGYVHTFKVISNLRVCVYLKYVDNKPAIRRLVRLSTPGNRIF